MTTFGIDLVAIAPFIAVGFAAQMVDGALGMAFGVISNTLLISLGMPPANASAVVHVVETFTTGISGISHAVHKNVDWRIFARLAIPGAIGAFLGAYLLSNIDAKVAKPFVLGYLALIGVYLLARAAHVTDTERKPKVVAPLGLIGGFLDAAGGGGWGPVVTSNLLLQGVTPRKVIGTVNTVEFFVTVTASATFIANLGIKDFSVDVLGLLIGGVIAAPLGAFVTRRIAAQKLLVMVGAVLIVTSGYGIYRALT
jgi:uncharacterized protein